MRISAAAAMAVLFLTLSSGAAWAQSSRRTNIADGDVWELNTADFGGFVEWVISWSKKADFDILVEGVDGNGDLFVACRGLSTQDGFERCHFGQGNTQYFLTISSFSGAKKAKGALWISKTDESITRVAGDGIQLRYVGNLNEPSDDPALQRLRDAPAHKQGPRKSTIR